MLSSFASTILLLFETEISTNSASRMMSIKITGNSTFFVQQCIFESNILTFIMWIDFIKFYIFSPSIAIKSETLYAESGSLK